MDSYRVGRKLGRTLYRNDRLIGVLDDARDASWIAELLNRAVATGETPPSIIGRATTEDVEAWLKRDQAINPATGGDPDAVAGS